MSFKHNYATVTCCVIDVVQNILAVSSAQRPLFAIRPSASSSPVPVIESITHKFITIGVPIIVIAFVVVLLVAFVVARRKRQHRIAARGLARVCACSLPQCT